MPCYSPQVQMYRINIVLMYTISHGSLHPHKQPIIQRHILDYAYSLVEHQLMTLCSKILVQHHPYLTHTNITMNTNARSVTTVKSLNFAFTVLDMQRQATYV